MPELEGDNHPSQGYKPPKPPPPKKPKPPNKPPKKPPVTPKVIYPEKKGATDPKLPKRPIVGSFAREQAEIERQQKAARLAREAAAKGREINREIEKHRGDDTAAQLALEKRAIQIAAQGRRNMTEAQKAAQAQRAADQQGRITRTPAEEKADWKWEVEEKAYRMGTGLQVAHEIAAAQNRVTFANNYLQRNPDGGQSDKYRAALEKDSYYLAELRRILRETSTTRGALYSGSQTAESIRNATLAGRKITDRNSFVLGRNTLRDWAARAERGEVIPKNYIDAIMKEMDNYIHHNTRAVVSVSNKLEKAFDKGDDKTVEKLLKDNKDLFDEYRNLMGDPMKDDEGEAVRVGNMYNQWAEGYNKQFQAVIDRAFRQPTVDSEIRLNQQHQAQQSRDKWRASGTDLAYDEWLSQEDERIRREKRVELDAAQAQADRMNDLVGQQSGQHFQVVIGSDGKLTVVATMDRNNPVNAPRVAVEVTMRDMGFGAEAADPQTLNRNPTAVEQVIGRVMDEWEADNPNPGGDRPQYRNPYPTDWAARRNEYEARVRAVFGKGRPTILDALGKSPLGWVWDAFSGIYTGVISQPAQDWARREGGELVGPQMDWGYPERYREYIQRRAVVVQRWRNGEITRDQMKADLAAVPLPDGQLINMRLGLDRSPEAKARADEKYENYITALEEAGDDLQRKLQIWNDYGTNVFSEDSDAGNVMAMLLGDPTNYVPLNIFSWVKRGKYALDATAGLSASKRILQTPYRWLSVSDRELRATTDMRGILRDIGVNANANDIIAELRRQAAGLGEVSEVGSLVTKYIQQNIDPLVRRGVGDAAKRDLGQLRRLAEDVMLEEMRLKGVDVIGKAEELRLRNEARATRRRLQAENSKRARREREAAAKRAEERRARMGEAAVKQYEGGVRGRAIPKNEPEVPPVKPPRKPKTAKERVAQKPKPPKAPPAVTKPATGRPVRRAQPVHVDPFTGKKITKKQIERSVKGLPPEQAAVVWKRWGYAADGKTPLGTAPKQTDLLEIAARRGREQAAVEKLKAGRGAPKVNKPRGKAPPPLPEEAAKVYTGHASNVESLSTSQRISGSMRNEIVQTGRRSESKVPLSKEREASLMDDPDYAAAVNDPKNPTAQMVVHSKQDEAYWRDRMADEGGRHGVRKIDPNDPMAPGNRYYGTRTKAEAQLARALAESLLRWTRGIRLGGKRKILTEDEQALEAALKLSGKSTGDAKKHVLDSLEEEVRSMDEWKDANDLQVLAKTILQIAEGDPGMVNWLYTPFGNRGDKLKHALDELFTPLTTDLKAGFDPVKFALLINRVDELVAGTVDGAKIDGLLGPVGFSIAGEHLFQLFHGWKASGRMDDILKASEFFKARVADVAPDLKRQHMADATWFVMESRSVVPHRFDSDIADQMFRRAAVDAHINPMLGLGMIPATNAGVVTSLRTRLRPILGALERKLKIHDQIKHLVPEDTLLGKMQPDVAVEVVRPSRGAFDIGDATRTAWKVVEWVADNHGTMRGKAAPHQIRARLHDMTAWHAIASYGDEFPEEIINDAVAYASKNKDLPEQELLDLATSFTQQVKEFGSKPFGTRVGGRTLTVDYPLKEAINAAYWRRVDDKGGEFVTHNNAAAHIMAYFLSHADLDVNQWATQSRVFLRHMTKGAGVPKKEVAQIISVLHGQRLRNTWSRAAADLSQGGNPYRVMKNDMQLLYELGMGPKPKDAIAHDRVMSVAREQAEEMVAATRTADETLQTTRVGDTVVQIVNDVNKGELDLAFAVGDDLVEQVDNLLARLPQPKKGEKIVSLQRPKKVKGKETGEMEPHAPLLKAIGRLYAQLGRQLDGSAEGVAAAAQRLKDYLQKLPPTQRAIVIDEIMFSLTDEQLEMIKNLPKQQRRLVGEEGKAATWQMEHTGKPKVGAVDEALPADAKYNKPVQKQQIPAHDSTPWTSRGPEVVRKPGGPKTLAERMGLPTGPDGKPIYQKMTKDQDRAYDQALRDEEEFAAMGDDVAEEVEWSDEMLAKYGKPPRDTDEVIEQRWLDSMEPREPDIPLEPITPDEAIAIQTAEVVRPAATPATIKEISDEIVRLRQARAELPKGSPAWQQVNERLAISARARQHLIGIQRSSSRTYDAHTRFAAGVASRVGKKIQDLVPDGRVAHFIQKPEYARVERVRDIQSQIMSSSQEITRVTPQIKQRVDPFLEIGPSGSLIYDELDLKIAEALHAAGIQARQSLLDRASDMTGTPKGSGALRDLDTKKVQEIRNKVLRDEGYSPLGYLTVRRVLRKGGVKERESVRLYDEALTKSKISGRSFRDEFLDLRHERAQEQGLKQLQWEASTRMLGMSDGEIVDNLFRMWEPDGNVRGQTATMSSSSRYVAETAVEKLSGVKFSDDLGMSKYLSQNRPPNMGFDRQGLKEFMRDTGYWRPRELRQFDSGANHWSAAEQRAFHWRQYRSVPEYLDEEALLAGGYFDSKEAFMAFSRRFRDVNDDALIERRLRSMTAEEFADAVKNGDESLGLKPVRTREQERAFWRGMWGHLITDKDGNFIKMPWLMNEQELDNILPEMLAPKQTRESLLISSQNEVDAYKDAVRKVMDDMAAKGRSPFFNPAGVHANDITAFASEVARQLWADTDWLSFTARRSLPSRTIHAMGEVQRFTVMSTLAFAGVNLPDTIGKSLAFLSDGGRSIFKARQYDIMSDMFKTVEDIDPRTESAFGLAGEALTPIQKIRKNEFTPTRATRAKVQAYADVVRNFSPGLVSGVEKWGKIRVARQVGAQIWDGQVRLAKAVLQEKLGRPLNKAEIAQAEEMARYMTRIQVRKEVNRLFPNLGRSSFTERVFNDISPFISYTIKNQVVWISEIFEHPAWVNRINLVARGIEDYNRRKWAEAHPDGEPMPAWMERLLELPWAPGAYMDLSQWSDATRGLRLLSQDTMPVKDWLWRTFRLLPPSTIAAIHAVTDGLGFTGHWGWTKQLDKDGFWTGGVTKTWIPDGEPWSGNQVTLGSVFWPFDIANLIGQLADEGLTPTEWTRIIHKTLFYGDMRTVDPRAMEEAMYFKLFAENPAAARQYLIDNPALNDYWISKRKLPVDFFIPKNIDPDAPNYMVGHPDVTSKDIKSGKDWLDAQPYDFRVAVGRGYAGLNALKDSYQARLDAAILAGDFRLASDIKRERRIAVMEYYRTHPELHEYEVFGKSPDEWAEQLDEWVLDDLVDGYFGLLDKRPKQKPGESYEAFQDRRAEWQLQVDTYRQSYPQVAERVRNSVDAIATAQEHQEQVWKNAFDRMNKYGNALEAARQAEDYAKVELIYALKDIDAALLETDVWAKVEPGDLGRKSLRTGMVSLPDFNAMRLNNMTPREKEQFYADRKYATGMKEIIAGAKKGGEFDAAEFVRLMKNNPELMAEYFARNPGKEREWEQNQQYIDAMGRFGRLMKAGRFDAGYEYFDSLPPWMRDRYYEKYPGRKQKRIDNQKYLNWWGKFHKMMDNGNRQAAFDYYDNMPPWVARRYYADHPNKRRENEQNGRYAAYMQRWVGFFKRDNPDAAMRYFDNLPGWVKQRYYDNHPGAQNNWGRQSEYGNYMGQWIKRIENGNWDKSNAYFWDMPAWVRQRYFKTHPNSGMRKTKDGAFDRDGNFMDNKKFKEYGNYMEGWIKLIEKDDWDKSNAYFWDMPAWVRKQYFKNNPDSGMRKTKNGGFNGGSNGNRPDFPPSGDDKEYIDAMGKFVAFYEAGDEAGAEAFFRSLPAWMRNRYLARHPDKFAIDIEMEMQVKLRDYFNGNPAHRAQYLADHPEVAEFLNKNSGASQRTSMLFAAYEMLPDDEFIKRSFREQYPDVFSTEAREQKRAEAKWREAAELGLSDEMLQWMESLARTSMIAMQHQQKPPKPVEFVHEKRRKKKDNDHTYAPLSI